MRSMITTAVLLVLATPLAAQEPGTKATVDPLFPVGWQARLDQADASLADAVFRVMGEGFRATLGPSAIFYNPMNTAAGEYRARATFTQTSASRYPEAYGLLIGGQDLDEASQRYLYFLIRQDGKFLVKERRGEETRTLVEWTEHPMVRMIDEEGKATNGLAVDVRATEIRFLVNGTEVARLDRTPDLVTDGIVGLRVNHNLDVQIDDFGVDP